MVNLYKFPDNTEFLVYSDNTMEFPEMIKVELVKDNVDLSEYMDLPLMNYEQLIQRMFVKGARTSDKILSEERIESFRDLQIAYFLLKKKLLNKSKHVRDLVKEKYDNIIQYFNPSGDNNNIDSEKES
jgi:hypothetical protein